jgi:hypothetical protein
MTFFDRKEEVIQIKLTPYGKRVLGEGNFNPDSYAFFDDDLLYDVQYGGLTEIQNDAHNRIKETPRTHIQYLFDAVSDKSNTKISYIDREYGLSLALGEADHGQYYPAWDIQFLKGELLSATGSFSGSNAADEAGNKAITGQIKIPQLNIADVKYTTAVEKAPTVGQSVQIDECEDFSAGITTQGWDGSGHEFADGTTITLKKDFLLLEIEEENSPLLSENFDIELFEIEPKGTLKTLYFRKDPEYVKNDILLDPEDVEFSEDEPLDDTYAEYYFDILTDDEINKRLICSLLPRDNPDGLNSRRMLNCEELEQHGMARDALYEYPDTAPEEEC